MNYAKWTLFYMTIGLNLCLLITQGEAKEPNQLTSVTGMQMFSAKFIEKLSSYAIKLEEKLHFVRGALIQLETENQRALNQTEYYLSNPLNAFSLIRRMHQDWVDWKSYMEKPVGLMHKGHHRSELPVISDLKDREKSHSTSVAGMEQLLKLETQLIENLSKYGDELEKKLQEVRSFVFSMGKENDKANSQTEQYLSNPLNAFSLIRRMREDWTHWQHYMEQPVGVDQINFIVEKRALLPTSTDLEEAAASIHRIVTTYDIKVFDMVKGLLFGKQYNVSLNGLNSYAMGKYLYDQERYGEAALWIFQSIEWLSVSHHKLPLPLELDKSEVYHLYAETLIQMDRFEDAIKVIDLAITYRTDSMELLLRKSEIETMIRVGFIKLPKRSAVKNNVGPYERGCRGLFPMKSALHCVYNRTNSPFLQLAPLKMELVNLDPYMVLYHDVISPSEILELQSLAVPTLKRATVFQHDIKRNSVVKTRTSKVSWLPDTLNNLTRRLNKRISDMTGFDLFGSEMLQVMNYGLGGHYDKHFDYFNSTAATELTRMNGDRIATVLFYLTDVEQGGATVFPKIEKAVFPKKGAAIIWYNLLHNGEGDTRTLHAACPVLVGSKWVCNKWVRERQQLFRRPCLRQ